MTTESGTNLPVLSGGTLCPVTLFDGQTHFGVAVAVKADGKESYLMIPDATNITKGQPVYITKPVTIKGEHLAAYLQGKNVSMPDPVKNLLKTTSISCDAFYFSKNERPLTDTEKGEWLTAHDSDPDKASKVTKIKVDDGALLMMFELKFNDGLIGALTEDEDLGKLFEISGASLRVLRCRDSSKTILEEYAKLLGGE
ncbi:hypothetical protein [Candidatus Accumulibacter sp. ACC007]|uniref:hypothetical protein n=1 Tax=Candidatus Accumulibacter sp. ACC007 TaxID=2823333 RepID=UPI0025BABD04|nr:hypothetical protein [Candidatus Accumulibacter sp. ACC007]